MKEKKTSKTSLASLLPIAVVYVLILIAGSFLGIALGPFLVEVEKLLPVPVALGILLVWLIAAYFLHIIIHEAGHLIGGLLSGYRFGSFRIGRLTLCQSEEGLKLRRFKLAGTAGQCLMLPPLPISEDTPTTLYNLGGVLINFIVGGLALLLMIFVNNPLAEAMLLIFAAFGIFTAILNGIPNGNSAVPNDGANALTLSRDKQAAKFLLQSLVIDDAQRNGTRIKDMPDEWFPFPEEEQLSNPLAAGFAANCLLRLVDQHRFEEAAERIKPFVESCGSLAGIFKSLLNCELIYLELIGENNSERVESLLSQEQCKFMKSMSTYPSVMRTEYALALLHKQDKAKALALKERFEKVIVTTPYPGDAELERGLMALAEEKA